MKPSIQFVKRKDGVKIAYSKFGKGTPLVIPPPWTTSLRFIIEDPYMNHFMEHLSQKVTVVFYDKHGCGQSDRNREVFTLESELLDQYVTEILRIDPQYSIGQFALSMPFKDKEELELYLEALRKAGLPE